jgi:hypothetical protein
VLGIYVFSVCKGKFGEVERLTVVVVEMVVGVGWRCTQGAWKGSWMVSVTGCSRECEEMDVVIRVGDRGIVLPLEASGRRWMWEHSTEKIHACGVL